MKCIIMKNLSKYCWRNFFLISIVFVGLARTAEYDVMWTVPESGVDGLPYLHVMVGDTVNFIFGTDQPHNVWIHGNDRCEMDPDNRIQVVNQQGLTSDGLKGSYTFTEPTRGFFVCDIGGHCEKGLNIFIEAHANVEDFVAAGGDPSKVPASGGTSNGGSGGSSGTGDGAGGSASSESPDSNFSMFLATISMLVLTIFEVTMN